MKTGMEDVDVFLGPHAHMRVLLDRMKVRLSNTDFRDRNSVATLLFELQYIFSEFKKHEEIEDMYIVDELRSRMVKVLEGSDNDRVVATQRKPEIALEKDLHGDERLSAVIHVISNVQDVTRRHTCNRVIRLRQGQRLCEVLDEFTVDFVPHMREEEQVFQPLLARHFTSLELIHLRDKVIQLHANNVRAHQSVVSGPLSVQAWWSRCLPALPGWDPPLEPEPETTSRIVELYEPSTTIDSLPTELLLVVLKMMDDVPSLLRASQVCRYWRTLAFDGSLWRSLYLRQWFLRNWHFSCRTTYNEHPDESDEEEDELEDGSSSSDGDQLNKKECLRDYDLDGDREDERGAKSAWRDGQMKTMHTPEEETRFLYLLCTNLLPMVGRHARLLSLHGCTSLTNDTLRRILYLCPNIEHLSIAYTKVSTFGLDSRLHRRLTRISASACKHISDVSLQSLALCLRQSTGASLVRTSSDRSFDSSLSSPVHVPELGLGTPLGGSRTDLLGTSSPRLWYLDISGCHMLTDQGLSHLINSGPFPDLSHLDLSGLSRISGATVKRLVQLCPGLNPDRFFYCERIPHDGDEVMKTAEACRGICHKGIACCRFSS